MTDIPESFEDFAQQVKELAWQTRANVCPVWQCGGELEHIEDGTNWQEPHLRCKNCGAFWKYQRKEQTPGVEK